MVELRKGARPMRRAPSLNGGTTDQGQDPSSNQTITTPAGISQPPIGGSGLIDYEGASTDPNVGEQGPIDVTGQPMPTTTGMGINLQGEMTPLPGTYADPKAGLTDLEKFGFAELDRYSDIIDNDTSLTEGQRLSAEQFKREEDMRAKALGASLGISGSTLEGSFLARANQNKIIMEDNMQRENRRDVFNEAEVHFQNAMTAIGIHHAQMQALQAQHDQAKKDRDGALTGLLTTVGTVVGAYYGGGAGAAVGGAVGGAVGSIFSSPKVQQEEVAPNVFDSGQATSSSGLRTNFLE